MTHDLMMVLFSRWTIGVAILVLWTAVLIPLCRQFIARLRRLGAQPNWPLLDILTEALAPALSLAVIVAGIGILVQVWPIPSRWNRFLSVVLVAGVTATAVVFADGLARRIVRRGVERFPALRGGYGLIDAIVRGAIVALGVLVFLGSIGISISPILASLGIGSLAVALALQDTLKNLFAGMWIIVDCPIEAGDFVRLESGQEARLARIGWRSSEFESPGGSSVLIPNSRLSESVLTNYRSGDGKVRVAVDLTVAAANDIEKVEAVTLEVAHQAAQQVPGAELSTEDLYFRALEGATVKLTVMLKADNAHDLQLLRHEFVKRLTARYQSEQIKLP